MPLGERRTLIDDDVHALLEVVTAVRPALVGRGEELHRGRLVRLVLDPVALDEDAVLQHPRAEVLVLEDVQVLEGVELARRRVLRLKYLGELVVRHRRRCVDLVLKERHHCEVLLDQLDILLRVHAVLHERGLLLELVPEDPDAELLAPHLLERLDAARLEGHLGRAAPGVDLSDVDEIVAGVPVREQARQPVDAELRAASEHDLLGDDVRAARLDVHVEAGLLVKALRFGGVVAGELRLDDPLALERHLRQLAARPACGGEARRAADPGEDGHTR